MKQIHTCKGPPTSFCSFIKLPYVKSTPPPLHPNYFIKKMPLKNISSVITVVVFTYICVFYFSMLVSVNPQKYNLMWYTLKHGVTHNPTLHSRHWNFILVSLHLPEHTRHRIILPCLNQCCVLC
jgi:hypothetical protein